MRVTSARTAMQTVMRDNVLSLGVCVAFLLVSPSSVTAQQRVFIDGSIPLDADPAEWVEGLSELTNAVAGTYGDEGVRINAALDKMAAGLAKWDRTIRAFEAKMASELPGAPPRMAFQMRATLAGMYLERGRRTDALRELDAASRLEPSRADLHVLRGLVLDASGKSMDADEAFRRAWDLNPGNPIAAYHVFRRAAADGNTKTMQAAGERLAVAYRTLLQDRPRAKTSPFFDVNFLQDRATDSPALAPVAYAQGYALIAHGEYDDAIATFRKAAAIDPLFTDPAARSPAMTQAIAALRNGRVGDARSLLEGATALQNSSEAHRMLGLIYWTNAEDGKSREQLETAIRLNPRDERSRLALSRVLSSAGRDADSERTLQETIQLFPDSAQARWWLGSGYERANRFADARREFVLAAPGAIAGRTKFFAKIGQLAVSGADIPAAVDAYARSLAANLNDPESHKRLAGALLLQDRPDEAFVELVAALLIDPLDPGAHAGIGQIHLNAGRNDEAATALRRAVELAANHTEARYALATALMRLGKKEEATREFERVQESQRHELDERRRSMSLDILKEEAALRAAEGDYDRAAALWQQVIDRERAAGVTIDPDIYQRLSELYTKLGRVDEAAHASAMYKSALREHAASTGVPP